MRKLAIYKSNQQLLRKIRNTVAYRVDQRNRVAKDYIKYIKELDHRKNIKDNRIKAFNCFVDWSLVLVITSIIMYMLIFIGV